MTLAQPHRPPELQNWLQSLTQGNVRQFPIRYHHVFPAPSQPRTQLAPTAQADRWGSSSSSRIYTPYLVDKTWGLVSRPLPQGSRILPRVNASDLLIPEDFVPTAARITSNQKRPRRGRAMRNPKERVSKGGDRLHVQGTGGRGLGRGWGRPRG